MEVVLDQIGKRYGYEWIFKNVQLKFSSNNVYGLKGPNGSGKSTLLRILSGHLSPSEGKVIFTNNGIPIPTSDIYKEISYTGPYIDLIHQFTLTEIIDFHFKFKDCEIENTAAVIDLLELRKAANKQLGHFSSGMKQRVKLGLCLLSKTKIALIDEPGTNLDEAGVAWYQGMLKEYSKGKLVVVASNEERDYAQALKVIDVLAWKRK